MSEMKERFVCALVGAYAEVSAWRQKETTQFPALASLEDLEKRRLSLLEDRLKSFEVFCEELLKKPKDNPRYFHEHNATTLIPTVIAGALLFVRKPDELSRFVRRLYWDRTEDSQDFALLYATTLVKIIEGVHPREAVDFARRCHLGGGVFSDLGVACEWILKAISSPFVPEQTDGSGYVGALVGAHKESLVLPMLPPGWRRMEKLALRFYDASQQVVVKTFAEYLEERKR